MSRIDQAREILGENYIIVPIASYNHDVEEYLKIKEKLERATLVLRAIAGEELPFGAKLQSTAQEAAQKALSDIRS